MIIYYLIGRTFTNVVHHKKYEQLVLWNHDEAFRLYDVNIGDNPAEILEINGDLNNLLHTPITHATYEPKKLKTIFTFVTAKGTVYITWRGEMNHDKIEIEPNAQLEVAPHEYRPELTWQEAKMYCFSLTIDGTTGWRLPTSFEWNTLTVQDSICDYSYLHPWLSQRNSCMTFRNGTLVIPSNKTRPVVPVRDLP